MFRTKVVGEIEALKFFSFKNLVVCEIMRENTRIVEPGRKNG